MAKKEIDHEDRQKDKKEKGFLSNVKEGTVQSIYAIGVGILAIFFILAALDLAGPLGKFVYNWLEKLLGIGYFLLPVISVALSISFIKSQTRDLNTIRIISALILFLSVLGIIGLSSNGDGGLAGDIVLYPFLKLTGIYVTWIILIGFSLVSILLLSNAKLPYVALINAVKRLSGKNKVGELKISGGTIGQTKSESETGSDKKIISNTERTESDTSKINTRYPNGADFDDSYENYLLEEASKTASLFKKKIASAYIPPPLSVLERDHGRPEVGDIKSNANVIKRTLQNFGINVEMDEVSIGPSVTRYSLKPAEGVKLSKIVSLNNDLSLALAAHPIRIEAPIPGKSLVGIEIPNSVKTTVGLASMLSATEYTSSDKPLMISLGKSITGKPHFADLSKMPHLLIAGATGSGKSVYIHTLISSLIFRNSPEQLRFIMIDPKRVELTLYNKIPHLLTPVLTNPKKSILWLKWAAKEMERRYNILESESVRDIHSYHKNVVLKKLDRNPKLDKNSSDDELEEPIETMPYIVIVIDELADIMQTYPRELESAVVRLAQMSRAVGIHLILSTQRPSVNIITGLIKANIPSRIALQVSSQIDSRTILDMSGAEKLLGAGDMLYLGAEMSKPIRLQSPFITESEVKKVVKHLYSQYKDALRSEINIGDPVMADYPLENSLTDNLDFENEEWEDDELYEKAREIVISNGKASTSYLQRKLRIGYARAARLVDMLEERGVVGPADGSKPRSVIGMEGMADDKPEENTI